MTYSTGLRSAVCFAALVAGGAAQADVTAAQVWEDWKSQMAVYGEDSITIGAEEVSGDTVVIRDLSLSFEDTEIAAEVDFGDLTFEEQRNGSVKVTMAESYPATITGADGVVVTIMVTQDDLEMIVSGDPEAMNYAISADRYAISLQDIVDGDITFTGDVALTVNDLSSVYNTSLDGDLRRTNYEAEIASIDVLVDIKVPGADGEYVTGGGKMENMTMQGDVVIPADVDFENPEDMMANGFDVSGSYSIENAAYIFDVNADGDQAVGSISTGVSNLSVEMNSGTIAYDSSTTDVALSISGSEIPFPVEIGLSEYGVGFEMPLAKSDTPSDFGLSFDIVDLTINDMIWNLFDPGSVLPRDPATAQFALTGMVKPLFDLMDPAQQDAITASGMPFELANVTLDNLKVAVAGALVTGGGAFTFDNSDMQTFAPLPKPEGDVTVEINGLNGLLDNLISMGLVAQEDVMGPRMMMGMFARSTGDDQMETKLEVTSDGQVLANGQRLR